MHVPVSDLRGRLSEAAAQLSCNRSHGMLRSCRGNLLRCSCLAVIIRVPFWA